MIVVRSTYRPYADGNMVESLRIADGDSCWAELVGVVSAVPGWTPPAGTSSVWVIYCGY